MMPAASAAETRPPTTTCTIVGAKIGDWYTEGVSITLAAVDYPLIIGSGVRNIYYSIDGSAYTTVGPLGTIFIYDTEGSHTISYYAVDRNNNQEDTKTKSFNIDGSKPSTTASLSGLAGVDGWYRSDVTVTLTANDPYSGVLKTKYSDADLGWMSQTEYNPAAKPVITGDGEKTIYFRSVDNLLHIEDQRHTTVKIDTVSPTISGTPDRAPDVNGWYNYPVIYTFTCSDALSGIDGPETFTVTQSTDSASAVTTGTTHDKAGNYAEASYTDMVDTTAPSISGTPDRAANGNGWYNAPVTVTFTASDATSGLATFSPTSVVLAGEGSGQSASSSATDNAGNSASSMVSGINIDLTAPTTSDTVSGTTGSAGWYVGDVTVTLSPNDGLSGIKTTEYSTDGTTWTAYTAPVIVSAEGTTTVQYRSTDNADNLEGTKSVTFKVDTITPSTTLTPSRAANSRNWYNAPVDISFTASDATSDVKKTSYRLVVNGVPGSWTTYTPGTSVSISSEGTTVIRYRSTDNAGNIEDVNSYTIRIDTVKPTIAVSPTPSASWYTDNPVFHFTFDDSLSGIAKHSAADITVSTDSTGYEVVATAKDKAGNAEEMRFTVKVDTTDPAISGAADRAPNALGWYNAPVTVTFTATDATSDVATVNPSSVTLDREGAGQSASSTATDNAGNSASTTVSGINIDLTAPTTSDSLSGITGSNGWYVGDVTLTLSADGETSGLKATEYSTDGSTWAEYTAPLTYSAEGTTTVYYRSVDNADNVESTKSVTFSVDKTAPVSGAALSGTMGNNAWYVSDVVVTITATDDGSSGVGTTEYSTDGATWAQYTVPVTVSSDGPTTVYYRSADVAGNVEAAKEISFKVDKTAPVLTGKLTGDKSSLGWFNEDATLSVSSSDATSGISSVMYSIDGPGWRNYTDAVTVPKSGSHYVYYGAIDNAGNRQNGTSFAYFPPVSIQYIWSIVSPTATPTPTPTVTPTPEASATATATATPEITATPTVTPAPEPTTTTAQTQPGNNWWLYLLALLVVALGGAGVYFLFLRK